MTNDAAKKLREAAATIAKAAEVFGIAGDEIVNQYARRERNTDALGRAFGKVEKKAQKLELG